MSVCAWCQDDLETDNLPHSLIIIPAINQSIMPRALIPSFGLLLLTYMSMDAKSIFGKCHRAKSALHRYTSLSMPALKRMLWQLTQSLGRITEGSSFPEHSPLSGT